MSTRKSNRKSRKSVSELSAIVANGEPTDGETILSGPATIIIGNEPETATPVTTPPETRAEPNYNPPVSPDGKPLHKIRDTDAIVSIVATDTVLIGSDPTNPIVTRAEILTFTRDYLPKPGGHAPRNAFQSFTRLRRLVRARQYAAKKSLPLPTLTDVIADLLRS